MSTQNGQINVPKVTSPINYEQKCLCVLVLDISSSMEGDAINQLNKGVKQLVQDVASNITTANRLEIAVITFSSVVKLLSEPTIPQYLNLPTLKTSGSTKLVDAVNLALSTCENRKEYYKKWGISYYRPWIILITDGEPDSDQDINGLSARIKSGDNSNKFIFLPIGVDNANFEVLRKISPNLAPAKLKGLEFDKFFKWLSNSMELISNSRSGDNINLPSTDSWATITI